ncbi:DUF4381 domain-containing protein [Marinobacter sp. F4216]|uniref:DUF4381 domain-containing protein n=1 Tax=Marinobacter sp. F4216 TaxID=2874281 RepID=UPI001CBACF29|nr:DUF4381 domain-containing protein [Marinobacter sp. F4216]MBZ2169828.1 DUF4381 domain-containing protein [Marinobacter sp. F4216]
MSLSQQLANLRELPPPEMPGLWPQTWGWWLLFGLIGLAFVALVARRFRTHYRNRYRREALAELDELEQAWRQNPAHVAPLRTLPSLLKRVVIYLYGKASTAAPPPSLAMALGELAHHPLTEDLGSRLADLAYAPDHRLLALDPEDLLQQTRLWLETHHVPA